MHDAGRAIKHVKIGKLRNCYPFLTIFLADVALRVYIKCIIISAWVLMFHQRDEGERCLKRKI